ncbi:hypothetical protein BLA29_003797, partial [Euroglyphus maynei]
KTIETYRESVKTKGTAINEYIQQHNLGPLIRSAVDGATSSSSEKPTTATAVSDDGSDSNKAKTKDKSSVLVE